MISSDMSGESCPHRFGKIGDGLPGKNVAKARIAISSPFSKYRDEAIGIVPVPGI
jgi:hypothetical protein